MKNLQIEEIYELYTQTAGVCTDTRNILQGGMFFALKGETFNGNAFAVAALEGGAAYAVVDEPQVEEAAPERIILVEDVLVALQQMARHHRKQFRIPVVALTGTNGKTTTKELVAACLAKKYNVVATQGNLNNHIGVPLTLLRLNAETQAAVIEMGASNPGEIETLVKLVCPSFGLITNVGKAHLQGFGSLEGVMATKGELYDNLAEHRKIAFVNVDNPLLVQMAAKRQRMQIVPYGVNNNCAKVVVDEGGSPFLSMVIPNPCITDVKENGASEWLAVKTNLIGAYNADNVLAALCISSYLDVETADAIAAIAEYVPSNNRSQLTETGRNSLIVDAYNANPTSMRASIENFASLNLPAKMLILGDMRELGADSETEHQKIIDLLNEKGLLNVFLVGECFAKTQHSFASFSNVEELSKYIKKRPISGQTILIKGSNGIKLNSIIPLL
jgi:UDP-N-acetylmuramoyl-tripeptide--D-alanyl-D-alanine ligase